MRVCANPLREWASVGAVVAALAALSTECDAEDFEIEDGDVQGLIGAINQANANDEPDTIHLAPGGTYTLTEVEDDGWGGNGLPRIESEITIEGNGATIERDAGEDGPDFRFFFLESSSGADLTLVGLTLVDGKSSHGGAIRNWGNPLTLIDSAIIGSTAVNYGGAIHSDGGGTLTLVRTSLTGNSASRGGAINKHGSGGGVTLVDCTLAGNAATSFQGGGAISFEFGVMDIAGTTISGNDSVKDGGGLRLSGGSVSIVNSTISKNTCASNGGGVWANANLSVAGSTLSDNAAGGTGGGIYCLSPNVTLTNTIVANSAEGGDVRGNSPDGGYNLFEDGEKLTEPTSMAGDPMLGALGDNGGPTYTHALLDGSPALDAGDCAGGELEVDQRGEPRPQGDGCDIGAFESAGSSCPADCDANGELNVLDFVCFQGLFQAGAPEADCDANGVLNVLDFVCFQGEFVAGCP